MTSQDVEKNFSTEQNLNFLKRFMKRVLTFMVNRYIFLHKMDNLFIDLKLKSIYYKMNQRREPILRMMNGNVKNYSLDNENYERLVAILKEKDKSSDNVSEKLSVMENDIRGMKKQLKGIKETLHGIALKLNVMTDIWTLWEEK